MFPLTQALVFLKTLFFLLQFPCGCYPLKGCKEKQHCECSCFIWCGQTWDGTEIRKCCQDRLHVVVEITYCEWKLNRFWLVHMFPIYHILRVYINRDLFVACRCVNYVELILALIMLYPSCGWFCYWLLLLLCCPSLFGLIVYTCQNNLASSCHYLIC